MAKLQQVAPEPVAVPILGPGSLPPSATTSEVSICREVEPATMAQGLPIPSRLGNSLNPAVVVPLPFMGSDPAWVAAVVDPSRPRRSSAWNSIQNATGLVQVALTTAEIRGRSWNWRQSATLIVETVYLSLISNVTAVVMATIGGWCTPFANRTEHASRALFVMVMVMQFCALGTFSSCVAIGFFLRGRILASDGVPTATRSLRFRQRTYITLRLSWWAGLLGTVFVGITVYALMEQTGVPLAEYNGHTLILVLAVATHALATITRVMGFRQRKTIRDPRSSITTNGTHNSGHQGRRLVPVRRHRQHALRRSLSVALPTVVASFAGIQYVSFSKRLDLSSRDVVFAFSAGSLVLKFFFQIIVKLFIWQSHERNVQNIFYMITAPIVIIEMQIRMSLLLAQSTLSIYVSSAILACVEIVIRITAVLIDFVVLEVEARRLTRKKQLFILHSAKGVASAAHSGPSFRSQPSKSPEIQLLEFDERFRTWRNHHLRLCAIEIRAEILSEYCGLAFASILTAILSRNSSFQLGAIATIASSTQTTSLTNQVAAFLIQMGFELGADVLASAIEMRLGIPLVDAISRNERDYIVFVVFVVAVHAGAMCISSFVAP